MSRVAVIILNWNGKELLKQFLPTASKYTQGEDVDLVVADNGSTDGSVEWIKEHHPEVMLIEYRKNLGFAEGYNRAIEILDYPYSLLLNSDVEVTEGWWQPLFRFMEENPEVGALQPKIKSYRDKSRFEYAGAAGGFLDRLGYPYCRGRLFDCVEKDEGQYDGEVKDVVWASGAALLVRTDMFRRAGRLDPHFFAHMEEIDLCCRMIARGFRVVATSFSEVYHVGGASLNQGNPKKTYLNFRNNLLLLYKNLSPEKRGKILLKRRLMDTLAFGMFVLKLDFRNAWSVIRAHNDFRKMRKLYDEGKHFYVEPEQILSDRLIAVDRYLRRMKK
ncbi:glycosyltransferase family 2 protein [Lepagella muris]|uniref:Glycosyltransferase family 2 protein n=1 Tax=Lepagella muris TaxID=3032870 RepID=A0AC61RLK2_9BACT|nr:glycosyltransferase family 2 protein [Lepagella muris]ROT03318.1 glycosyltransferase family 2 protein [Muribaculaceae bacterium Isolate-037 (Harlan)]TGY78613.1 glycosyltransferase family 2 protein [Lepagella muris]THG52067.1 glycosyltransferase family 2 protein [Bacteroidales bacterium]TKC54468.1 glycosyltransferase family 2 protein [Bacteroidales bacterium]